jgi:hypothetical protein
MIRLTQTDTDILQAVNRLHYVTSSQLGRLLYTGGERSSQRRLKRLCDGGYLLRLRALPVPRYGSAPHVFSLANRGRRVLAALGIELTSPYMRPSEEQKAADNNFFMAHTLAAVDVLVAALALCRDSQISCPQLLNERQLKRRAVSVRLPGGRETRVIPDGWLQLQTGQEPPISIALELDRGTEEQKRWRQKVQALASWAGGPYQEAFATDNLTLAVVTPTEARREQPRDWTRRELAAIGREELGELFLFTSESPVLCSPFEFFCSPLWQTLDGGRPVGLLEEADAPATHPPPDRDVVLAPLTSA